MFYISLFVKLFPYLHHLNTFWASRYLQVYLPSYNSFCLYETFWFWFVYPICPLLWFLENSASSFPKVEMLAIHIYRVSQFTKRFSNSKREGYVAHPWRDVKNRIHPSSRLWFKNLPSKGSPTWSFSKVKISVQYYLLPKGNGISTCYLQWWGLTYSIWSIFMFFQIKSFSNVSHASINNQISQLWSIKSF